MTKSQFARLSECLWPKGERRNIWMILDTARSLRVFETLLESSFVSSCLYAGYVPRALEASVPYLVQLEYQEKQSQRLLERAWGNSWGIVLRCDARMETLRRHLRGFLRIRSSKGQRFLFRYYDPRILRTYLPTCTGEELRTFFGPIEQFWIDAEDPNELVRFSLDSSRLLGSVVDLNSADPLPLLPPATAETYKPPRLAPSQFVVRTEQMSTFSKRAEKQFEDWMAEHLRKFFKRKCGNMGEDRLRDTIRHGIRSAATHGLTIRREVCKYIDVMLVFGRDFDKDPEHAWARQILARSGQDGKGQALIDAAQKRLVTRAIPDNDQILTRSTSASL